MEDCDDEPTLQLRDFVKEDLPREKLLQYGRNALTDEELIAIFLRTGLHGCNVLELAGRLKRAAGSLSELGRMEARQIMNCCKGIGAAKAATLAAVFELGHRTLKEELRSEDMMNPSVIYEYLGSDLRYRPEENMVVLLLNAQRRLIRRCDIARGTLTRVLVHPRSIFREAVIHNACSIILAHNHPSGDPHPSKHDMELTDSVRNAGEVMGIPLKDHVILGAEGSGELPYYSFRNHGLLP